MLADSTLTIVLTALPPTLVALGALIVGIVNSVKANKIHILVNSNLTTVKSDLAMANTQIQALQQMIALQANLSKPSDHQAP